jgi:polysaccharide pyruvyl transferase WcaK-like protein
MLRRQTRHPVSIVRIMRKSNRSKNPPETVLIVGGAGWKNVGDDLIARSLKQWVSVDGRKIEIAGGPHPHECVDAEKPRLALHGSLASRLRIAWRIARVDYVLIGGGGLLDDRIPLFYRPFTRTAFACRILRTPYSFAAIGVGPIRRGRTNRAYRDAVQGADRVFVRDQESKDRLLLAGMIRDAEIVADPVLWGQPETVKSNIQVRFDVAVNLRNWHSVERPRDGYDGPHDGQIIEAVSRAINATFGRDGRVALVSMSGLTGDDDSIMLEKLRAKLDADDVQTFYGSLPTEVERTLASSASILAMRLHACLLGARLGRQVIGLAYDPKIEQQGKSLGFTAIPLDQGFCEAGQDRIGKSFETAPRELKVMHPGPTLPWD